MGARDSTKSTPKSPKRLINGQGNSSSDYRGSFSGKHNSKVDISSSYAGKYLLARNSIKSTSFGYSARKEKTTSDLLKEKKEVSSKEHYAFPAKYIGEGNIDIKYIEHSKHQGRGGLPY